MDTATAIAQVYIALNAETWQRRFQYYLLTEFLGGVGENTPCQIHSATWFDSISNGEAWAILSMVL